MVPLVVDRSLARRVDGALRSDAARFVAGMRVVDPAGGAHQLSIAGGLAAYTGPRLFACRVQAAGLDGPVPPDAVDAAERFYDDVGTASEFEVCPLADRSLPDGLAARGYRLAGFRNVYVLDVRGAERARHDASVDIVVVTPADLAAWSGVVLDGFGYVDDAARQRVSRWNAMMGSLPEATLLLARRDGLPIGAANVLVHGDVASFGGTTTLPGFRRQGVQSALLSARIALAAAAGCELAVVTADPGGGSARNIERAGFRLAYTNVRLRR